MDNENLARWCPRCGFDRLAHVKGRCPRTEYEARQRMLRFSRCLTSLSIDGCAEQVTPNLRVDSGAVAAEQGKAVRPQNQ